MFDAMQQTLLKIRFILNSMESLSDFRFQQIIYMINMYQMDRLNLYKEEYIM